MGLDKEKLEEAKRNCTLDNKNFCPNKRCHKCNVDNCVDCKDDHRYCRKCSPGYSPNKSNKYCEPCSDPNCITW